VKLPRHLLVCFSLALFALVSYFTARGQVQPLGAIDHIRAMAPMNGPAPDQPWDVLQADGSIQFYVWRDLVFESWGKGKVPGWNPYELCGTPLLANSQSGGFYPLHILMGVLHVPTRLAILLLAVFHLAASVLGVVLLTRALGAKPFMQWVAGVGFGYSAFLLSWVGLSSVPTTVCWIPWALWGLVTVATWRDMWRVAVPVGLMILGGHLQFVAYGLMAWGLVWVGLMLVRKQRMSLVLALAGLGLGVMLSAPQLLPVLDFGKNSHRRDPKGPTEEGYAGYAASGVGAEATSVVTPQVLGNPDRWAPIQLQNQKIGDTWLPAAKRGANYAESAFGIGAVLFIALFLIRKTERTELKEPLIVGLVPLVVGVLMGTGSPLSRLMYFTFPGWSSTGSPGRAMLLFVLGAAVLASLATGWKVGEKPKLIAVGLGGLVAVILTALTMSTQSGAIQPWVQTIVQGALPITLLMVFLGVGLLWVAGQDDEPVPLKWAAAGALVPLLLLFGASAELPTPLKGQYANERVAFVNDRWSLWTLPKALMPGNLAALNRVREASGYDSLMDRDTFKMLGELGTAPTPPENGNMVFINSKADRSKLAELGVTKVISGDGTEVEDLKGPGLAIQATVNTSEPGHIILQAMAGSTGYRERAIQGWSAKVNGAPAELTAGPWLQVSGTKPGDTVEFSYSPPKMKQGLIMALIAAVILLLPTLRKQS